MEEIKQKYGKKELKAKPQDLIEAITRNSLEESKSIYNNKAIFDEFRAFFVAGVDTTSNYLAMMIYLTVQHPEVEEKVRAEIA